MAAKLKLLDAMKKQKENFEIKKIMISSNNIFINGSDDLFDKPDWNAWR
jgi:hypothetical protein